ncbi:hypothetical protein [Photobacterium leiognathi]|uniref:hypothetical protein n=1 Tax=Photobacterium leiognathi TaxID=553611 RepID=UPI002982556D|nr:hypothetical protein [Photobacterium leiognathi]
MIESTQKFTLFCRIVSEHMRSTMVMYWDDYEEGEKWCKQGQIEQLLSKCFGYNNCSELYHALKTGSDIKYASLNTLSNEKLDEFGSFDCRYVRETLLSSIFFALSTIAPPSEVTLSADFKVQNPVFVSSNHSYDESSVMIYLSLTDNKIYPFSYDDSPAVLNFITLIVPMNLYLDELLVRLNSCYAIQQLAVIRENQSFVGGNSVLLDTFDKEHLLRSIRCLSPITYAFTYHQMLLNEYLNSEPGRLKEFNLRSLEWQSIAYLFSTKESPFERLKRDLPCYVSLDAEDEESFILICSAIFLGKISRENSPEDPAFYLPQSYRRLFEIEFDERDERKTSLSLYRNRQLHEGVKICFVESEYRIWINYHQSHCHKVDKLLDLSYQTEGAAKQGAHQFLAKYEELNPDYEKLTTDEFTLKIIDSSQYLNVFRHLEYSVPMEAIVKRRQECINTCDRRYEYDSICQCHECMQGRRIQQYEKLEQFSFITGSGMSITKLRSPVRIVNPNEMSNFESI